MDSHMHLSVHTKIRDGQHRNRDAFIAKRDGITTNRDAFIAKRDGITRNRDAFRRNRDANCDGQKRNKTKKRRNPPCTP